MWLEGEGGAKEIILNFTFRPKLKPWRDSKVYTVDNIDTIVQPYTYKVTYLSGGVGSSKKVKNLKFLASNLMLVDEGGLIPPPRQFSKRIR